MGTKLLETKVAIKSGSSLDFVLKKEGGNWVIKSATPQESEPELNAEKKPEKAEQDSSKPKAEKALEKKEIEQESQEPDAAKGTEKVEQNSSEVNPKELEGTGAGNFRTASKKGSRGS